MFEVVGDQLKLKDGAAFDYEAQDSYDIVIEVTDSAGATYRKTLTINVLDINEAPENLQLSNASVSENDAGAVIGDLTLTDVDAGDTHTFRVSDDRFEIVDGQLKLKDGVALDHETEESVSVTVTATDAGGLSTETTFDIAVGDVNEAPDSLSFSNETVNENEAGAVVATLTSTDIDDGDSATYSIADDPSGLFEVVGDQLKLKEGVALDHEAQDSYDITVQVTDSGGLTFEQTITVNVVDVNEAPTDIALSGDTVAENDAGAVVATLTSSDPDVGDTATYSLADDPSGLFEVVGDQLKLKDGVALDHEAQDAYEVTLEVTDSAGATYQKTVTINVADVNEAPTDIMFAGAPVSVTRDAVVSNAEITTGQGGGQGTATVALPDGADAVITIDFARIDNSFEIEVNGESLTGGTIQLQRNVFDPDTESFLQFEDGAAIHRPWVPNSDGSPRIQAIITEEGVQFYATRTPTSGVLEPLELTNGSITPPDLAAGDNTVTVINPDSAGPDGLNALISAQYETSGYGVDENDAGAVVATLTSSDPDIGDTATYSLADDPSGLFEVVGDQLKLKDGVALDYEEQTSYDLTVRVTDSGGLSYEETVTINVADVNEAPTDIALSNDTVAENDAGAVVANLTSSDPDAADTATYALADDPSGLFEVVGDQLKLKDGVALDHEAQDSYEVTLAVTDSAGATYQETVTINVADVNEAPTDIQLTVAEGNLVQGSSFEGPNVNPGGWRGFSNDPSGAWDSANGVEIWDNLFGNQASEGDQFLELDYTNAQDSISQTVDTVEGKVYNLSFDAKARRAGGGTDTIEVYWNGEKVGEVDPTSAIWETNSFQVVGTGGDDILEFREAGDENDSLGAHLDNISLTEDTTGVAENVEGVVIGTLNSSDPDAGDTASYAIADDPSGLFEVVGDQLKLKDGVALDYEAQGAYDVTLRVTDSGGLSYEEAVTINVADMNEGPTDIALSGDTVAENDVGAVVATLTSSDPDAGDTATYSLAEDPSGLFEVVGDQLKLKDDVALDHEAQDAYDVTLRITDSGGLSYEETVTINVADVNEGPTDIALSGDTVAENDAGAVVANLASSDSDAGDTATYALADDPSGLFEVVGDQLKLKDGAALDHEAQDAYDVTLRVTDSGGLSYEETVTINVADVNEAPVDIILATPGEGAFLEQNGQLVIEAEHYDTNNIGSGGHEWGASSIDGAVHVDDGDVFNNMWRTETDVENNAPELTYQVQFDTPGDYYVHIRGASEDGPSGNSDSVHIGLNGERLTGDGGLTGFGGGGLRWGARDTYTREQVKITVDEPGTYELNLWAREDGVAVDKIVLTQDPAFSPSGEGPAESPRIGENGALAESAADGTVVATLSAVDPDNADSHAFEIVDSNGNPVADDNFEIVGNDIRVKPGADLDFETEPSHDLYVKATDASGASYVEVVSIDLEDVNEAPSDLQLSNASVAENDAGAVIGDLSVTDDAGDTQAYQVSDDRFEVVGSQLKLKDGISLDHEANESVSVTVTATDESGLSTEETFEIAVGDVNEAPTGLNVSNDTIAENDPGAVVATLSANDPDAGDSAAFAIVNDPSGAFEIVGDQLKLKDGVSLEHEDAAARDVVIEVTDGAGNTHQETITINVENVNTAPVLGLAATGGAGLAASYYDIGRSIRNLDQVDFEAAPDATGVVGSLNYMTGREPFWDGGPDNYFAAKYEGQLVVQEGGTYTIRMASDDGSQLFIDGQPVIDNDGLHGTRTRTVTLDLDEGAHDIELRYFENGGNQTLQLAWSGPDTGGANQLIDGDAFRHGVDVENLAVPEDTPGAVIAQLTVDDADAGDTHSYEVSDDRFEVVEQDGAPTLKLKDGVSLDHETEGSVVISVTVTDSAGASDTADFTIAVDDVNAAPTIGVAGTEGLAASYYDVGRSISNLSQIDFDATPDATGVVDSLNYETGNERFWDGGPDNYFAAKYEGDLVVQEGGTYTINMASDDGSQLFIDGQPVINNDGLHSTRTQSVTLDLEPGAHNIEIRYFENTGAQTLKLTWSGPDTDGETALVGGEALRQPGTYGAGDGVVTENAPGAFAALLTAADPDGDAIAFTVSDDRFEVVDTDGGPALKLKDDVSLDYETETSVNVTVTATDEHGESASADFDIQVADADDGPAPLGGATSGDDRLNGTSESDYIDGLAGADRINAGGGDDTVLGGEGEDDLRGGDGADRIEGGLDNDRLRGQDGDDVLFGDEGDDVLEGGVGDDALTGGLGDDTLIGNAGDDVFIYAEGDGSDVIRAGGGDWTDMIQFDGGIQSLGEFGVDWTVELTRGSIDSVDADAIDLSQNADGIITLNDGSTIEFQDLEQIM